MPASAGAGVWSTPPSSMSSQCSVLSCKGIRANGQIDGPLLSPFYDSPFYDTYVCADGRFFTIGALEPRFYHSALEKTAAGRRRSRRAVRSQSVARPKGTTL